MNQSFEEFTTHFNYHIELIKVKKNLKILKTMNRFF